MSDEKIQELEQEIKQLKAKLKKRYGLVWEDKKEEFDKDSKNALPILKDKNDPKYPNINTGVKNGKAPHILIEGDNYHTLSVLNYTHKGKIDVIYIDPPYNTGNNDFIYNDKFVDKEDSFRHSKWLSFMSKRLKLAKELLADDGVIFISIDDNEQAQLKLLCDEIFGEKSFIANFIWHKKSGRQNDAKFVSTNTEYVLCYLKNSGIGKINLLPRTEELNKSYKNPDNDPRGVWTSVKMDAKSGSKDKNYTITFNNGVSWSPTKGRYSLYSKEKLLELYQDNRIWFGESGKNVPRLKKFLTEVKQGLVPNTLLPHSEAGTTQKAKQDYKNILSNINFDNPKTIDLINFCILIGANKNSTILDFFAGSGTTGHAVLELNKQDGGNRQFILATNNENGICENITYERIKRVMQGYTTPKGKEVKGLGGELQYLKTDFIKKDNNLDDLRLSIVNASTTILCCKESIFNIVLDNYQHNKFKIFKDDNKYLCILFGEFAPNLQAFYDEFKKFNHSKVIIYAFVSDVEHLSTELKNIDSDIDFHIKEIPDELLATYNEIFGL
jgi:adenine-specific DNA-methyltransferase